MMTEDKKIPYKSDLKRHIIEESMLLFVRDGIKQVKMDDVSAQLGISKRTLYEQFANKEELLFEALKYYENITHEKVKEFFTQSTKNALEVILIFYKELLLQMRMINPVFFEDLNRYPQILHFFQEHRRDESKMTVGFLKRGVQEGIFRDDINFEIVHFVIEKQMKAIRESDERHKYPFEAVLQSVLLVQLRGISTPKGQAILEEFLKTNKLS